MHVSFFSLLKKLYRAAQNATPIIFLQQALGAFRHGLLRRPTEEKALEIKAPQETKRLSLPKPSSLHPSSEPNYQWKKRTRDAKLVTQSFREQAHHSFTAQERLQALQKKNEEKQGMMI